MAKIVYTGRRVRMVFGKYVHEGHVLDLSDKQAKTLEGDPDFKITYEKKQSEPEKMQENLLVVEPVKKKSKGKRR
jgi:hypothetical protein